MDKVSLLTSLSQFLEPLQQQLSSAPRGRPAPGRSPRADRSCSRSISSWTARPLPVDTGRRRSAFTQSAAGAAAPRLAAARSSNARSPSFRRSRSRLRQHVGRHVGQARGQPEYRRRQQPFEVRRRRAAPPPPALRPAGGPAPRAAPARPAARRAAAGTATAGASVFRSAAALRISSRTTASVIRALWASRSANWSRAAASGNASPPPPASGSETSYGCRAGSRSRRCRRAIQQKL